MAKSLALMILALFAISMLSATVMAKHGHGGHHHEKGYFGPGSVPKAQCGGKCNYRCSNTQYRNACLEFCNKCCLKCLCVPPGFYGNKQVCPCYNNWKTQEGGPKCP